MTIARDDITGLVLAGGRATRMGGVDKGLQPLNGQPLVAHALARLAPQVGTLAINANRQLEDHARFGHPVWPDALAAMTDYPGPLAGMLAGLQQMATPWLLTVPCDTPRFPADLAARLAAAAWGAGAPVAIAATREEGAQQPQPVFALLHRSLAPALAAFLASGQRKIDRFTAAQGQVVVEFADAAAFFNANTLADLALLQGAHPSTSSSRP